MAPMAAVGAGAFGQPILDVPDLQALYFQMEANAEFHDWLNEQVL